mmetsp:Transcript_20924/g.65989  ORF Transcript_20924/g.65989 Transcript_20924/m.65989 type:complete len:227 (-) Transcript_20924:141-821(-)
MFVSASSCTNGCWASGIPRTPAGESAWWPPHRRSWRRPSASSPGTSGRYGSSGSTRRPWPARTPWRPSARGTGSDPLTPRSCAKATSGPRTLRSGRSFCWASRSTRGRACPLSVWTGTTVSSSRASARTWRPVRPACGASGTRCAGTSMTAWQTRHSGSGSGTKQRSPALRRCMSAGMGRTARPAGRAWRMPAAHLEPCAPRIRASRSRGVSSKTSQRCCPRAGRP